VTEDRADNQVRIAVTLAERETLRFSPAGIPLLNSVLRHESSQPEAGTQRKVELEIPAVFAGGLAQAASRLALGTGLQVRGFLAPKRRQSRLLVLHVTEFELNEV
jgi:primosomal replication protein N